jgi:hypothetical protein
MKELIEQLLIIAHQQEFKLEYQLERSNQLSYRSKTIELNAMMDEIDIYKEIIKKFVNIQGKARHIIVDGNYIQDGVYDFEFPTISGEYEKFFKNI